MSRTSRLESHACTCGQQAYGSLAIPGKRGQDEPCAFLSVHNLDHTARGCDPNRCMLTLDGGHARRRRASRFRGNRGRGNDGFRTCRRQRSRCNPDQLPAYTDTHPGVHADYDPLSDSKPGHDPRNRRHQLPSGTRSGLSRDRLPDRRPDLDGSGKAPRWWLVVYREHDRRARSMLGLGTDDGHGG
jgi:hypothetical protein